MGNCGLKPATKEGEAAAPEQKTEEVVVESREAVVGEETQVISEEVEPPSLAQLIHEVDEGKVTEEAIPTPSKPVTETIIETKEVVATTSGTEEVELKKEVVEAVVIEEEEKKKIEEENK